MTAPATHALPQMTLRQWYAGQALVGLCANTDFLARTKAVAVSTPKVDQEALIAQVCVIQADAMIAALKESGDA